MGRARGRRDPGRRRSHDAGGPHRLWAEPLVADIGGGYRIATNPPPNNGGVALIEAQLLAEVSGLADYEELDPHESRFGGEGLWVAIQRDPETGELRAGSHNRTNSAAVAF
ncbi:MAG TPA: hypothetical protein VMT85_09860 [Thermoanaerobaculia bacterium]|nr:hypothetical protein [Thermoanaerobaculia bacterium]